MKFNKIAYNIFIKYTVLIVPLTLMISSCIKFLEEVPAGSLTTAAKLTSALAGNALVIGPYQSLPGAVIEVAVEYQTGKAFTAYSSAQFWKFQNDQISGEYQDFTTTWDNRYAGIRACNSSISLLPGITGYTETQRAAALAEVRTLRAWYYFSLVRYFGDVVMNTTVISDINSFEQPRTSLKTIYDKVIIPDLEYAVSSESGLKDERSTGHITKHVARAILADVYLTCAGYPYQEIAASTDTTKKWCSEGLWTMKEYPINTASAKTFLMKAKEQLDVLYSSGVYTLGTYDDLHDPTKNNKGEAIFQAQFLTGVTSSFTIEASCFPLGSKISLASVFLGRYIPSIQYYNSYNSSDKRIGERQFFFTIDTKQKNFDPSESLSDPFIQPHLFKFYDKEAAKNTGSSSLNINFYRYADILLMLTEVNWTLNQLTPGTVVNADVLKGINLVRTRALLPSYTIESLDLKAIMSERAYELIFENKMLWDMRRTRKCLVDGVGSFSAIEDFFGHTPNGFSYSFGPKQLLSPIGLIEINNNGKVLQNFGYLPKQIGQ